MAAFSRAGAARAAAPAGRFIVPFIPDHFHYDSRHNREHHSADSNGGKIF